MAVPVTTAEPAPASAAPPKAKPPGAAQQFKPRAPVKKDPAALAARRAEEAARYERHVADSRRALAAAGREEAALLGDRAYGGRGGRGRGGRGGGAFGRGGGFGSQGGRGDVGRGVGLGVGTGGRGLGVRGGRGGTRVGRGRGASESAAERSSSVAVQDTLASPGARVSAVFDVSRSVSARAESKRPVAGDRVNVDDLHALQLLGADGLASGSGSRSGSGLSSRASTPVHWPMGILRVEHKERRLVVTTTAEAEERTAVVKQEPATETEARATTIASGAGGGDARSSDSDSDALMVDASGPLPAEKRRADDSVGHSARGDARKQIKREPGVETRSHAVDIDTIEYGSNADAGVTDDSAEAQAEMGRERQIVTEEEAQAARPETAKSKAVEMADGDETRQQQRKGDRLAKQRERGDREDEFAARDLEVMVSELGVRDAAADGQVDEEEQEDDKDGKIYYFQFPSTMPPLHVIPGSGGVDSRQAVKKEEQNSSANGRHVLEGDDPDVLMTGVGPSSLGNGAVDSQKSDDPLPSGLVGRLVVRRSGKVTLLWGATDDGNATTLPPPSGTADGGPGHLPPIRFRVNRGMGTQHLATAMLVEGVPPQQHADDSTDTADGAFMGRAIGMGHVAGRFLVGGDLSLWLDEGDTDDSFDEEAGP